MNILLRNFVEIELPCENFTGACPSNYYALRATDNGVEFFISHAWSIVFWGQLHFENVQNFLRALYLGTLIGVT